MEELAKYKKQIGKELKSFLDGQITFEEMEEKITNSKKDINDDETVKLIWHVIYQYKTDCDIENEEYLEKLKIRIHQIALALIEGKSDVYNHLNNFFNAP